MCNVTVTVNGEACCENEPPAIVNNARSFQGFVNEVVGVTGGLVDVDISQMKEVTAVVRSITTDTLNYTVRPSYGEGIFHAPLAQGTIEPNEYVPVPLPPYLVAVRLEVELADAPPPTIAVRAELYGCGVAI